MEFISLCLTYLPDELLFKITSYLPLYDKYRFALTCRKTYILFQSPQNWTTIKLVFRGNHYETYFKCMKLYGKYFQNVIIELDQSEYEMSVNALNLLASVAVLKGLTIICTGEKRLFSSGKEIGDALLLLLSNSGNLDNSHSTATLIYINLEKYTLSLRDKHLHVLYSNQCNLQFLYIQHFTLLCNISPNEMLSLVRQCCKLKVLSVVLCCLSRDVMQALTEGDRFPLKRIYIKCRNSDKNKFTEIFHSELWLDIINKLPHLTVSVHVDETCPSEMVHAILKREIPYSAIRLETFGCLWEEVNLITYYYNNILEKLILHPDKNRQELDTALLRMSERCCKLQSLHVFCILELATIEKILTKHTAMKRKRAYTLKTEKGTGPWCTEEWLEQYW